MKKNARLFFNFFQFIFDFFNKALSFNQLKNEEKMRKMIVKRPLLVKNGTERLKVINFELFFYNQKMV